MTLLESITEWASHMNLNQDLLKLESGQTLQNAVVSKQVYGGSYIVKFPESNLSVEGFLHKIHTVDQSKKEDDDDEMEETKEMELKIG